MSDEQYNFQISGQVNGDLVVVRGDTAENMAEQMESLGLNAEAIIKGWSNFKTAAVAHGVFTGNAVGGKGGGSKAKADVDEDGVPKCKHGKMKDLRGNGYKSDFYCPEKDRDKQCKPVKL